MATGPITHTTDVTGITRSGAPASPTPPEDAGRVLRPSPETPVRLGRYLVLDRLGSGGMGVVYEALDLERNHRVALKTGRTMDSEGLFQLKNEFRAVADIVHPNLVALYELVAAGEAWFFTMELIDGMSFLAYVRQDPRPSEPTAISGLSSAWQPASDGPPERRTEVDAEGTDAPTSSASNQGLSPAGLRGDGIQRLRAALDQLVSGVSALHTAGKLHRDLKPSNVMVARCGRVVLLDFGIAIELLEESGHGSKAGHILGTAAYMAPEQGAALPLTPAADWYSVGVMLFEVLTGRLPFAGAPAKILEDKQCIEPPPPATLVEGIPEDLNTLCVELLRIRPRHRPTGAEILRRLRGDASSQGAISKGAAHTGPRATARPASARETPAPFIGRGEQLLTLENAYRAMVRGETVSVYVHGRSGMGKSALVGMFLESQRRRDEAIVLAGRCHERESVPYKAFDSLIDSLTQHLGRLPAEEIRALLPEEIHALARVFPVLQGVSAVSQAPPSAFDGRDPQELRRCAFRGLKILLGRIAERRPLVVFIDDIHWGDRDSAHLLAELLAPPDKPAVLLICTYRSEDMATSPLLGELFRDPRGTELHSRIPSLALTVAHTVTVEPLPLEDGTRLARAWMRRGDAAAEKRAQDIAKESAGSPLFIEQLVRHAEATSPDRDSKIDGSGTSRVSIDDLVLGQLAELPPSARRLLEVIAVAGRPLEQGVALAAASADANILSAIAVLRSEKLVRTRGARNRDLVESYHDRIRDLVVSGISVEVVKSHHLALATTLERAPSADPEVLALHFNGAGDLCKTREYAALAADAAASALAFDRAAELYRLAMECAEGDRAPEPNAARAARCLGAADAAREAWVRGLGAKRADALVNAGRCAEAAPLYLANAAEARDLEALDLRRRAAE